MSHLAKRRIFLVLISGGIVLKDSHEVLEGKDGVTHSTVASFVLIPYFFLDTLK